MARAVVIGASLSGLLAARVLTDHFDDVVVLERDQLPDDATFRGGVPQARHAHVLLERGRRILDVLLPGLEAEVVAAGGRRIDAARDLAFVTWAGPLLRYESGVPMLAVSRLLLEHQVRCRVLALTRVRMRAGVEVAALEGSAQHIAGVRTAAGEVIAADLVVDASGRRSRTPAWLTARGLAAPADSVVKPFVGYATRTYALPPRGTVDWEGLVAASTHPTRGCAVVPIEGGRAIATLFGVNRDYPPTDDAGYAAFAATIPVPSLTAFLGGARPLSPIHGYRFDENRLRHFERAPLPTGLIAVGDAVLSLNPIYGQGMSIARAIAPAWTATITEDLRLPGTEGRRDAAQRVARAYVDRVFVRAVHHVRVRRAALGVFGLVEPPTALFAPAVLWRVLTARMPKQRATLR